ncbi:hypothetical protein PF011_g26300 [Phytophthora fragariae]|uniref:START domain-containing protein n=1 Tax=Phytophthora fragariae TaxID=53985 RepID=A0A6A3HK97_9STRA|nr:hypothetical protein PF011_g26300 [Phytophthora fragariae]
MRLVHLLPEPTISRQDCTMLQNLADTLAGHNIAQYNTLVVTKDGRADPQRWREVRRRGSVRIYNERLSALSHCPATPQLLLLGTIEGKLEDIMYGAVATTDEAMKIESACTKDSVRDSKVLFEIVRPSFDDPFRTVAVKWRLYEGRDYVSLDATGIAGVRGRERIGYSISHSVALSEIPNFEDTHRIERGNMSVCALYRQKTPTTVECYVRGFFDFKTKNECSRTCRSKPSPPSGRPTHGRKTVVALAPDQHTVLERKRSFCVSCMAAVESCDVMSIAREELVGHQEEESDDDDAYWARLSSMTVNSSCYSSIVSRQSSLASLDSFSRRSLMGRGGSDLA